jgi:glycosyltransferase involved in cell wall biosynthesis
MRLLYISAEYPPETGYGGIGTYTCHCAEGMAARGHEVEVIAGSGSGNGGITKRNGVTIHRIGPGSYPLPQSRPWYPLRMLCYKTIAHTLIRLAWAQEVDRYLQTLLTNRHFDTIEYPECGAEGFYVARRKSLSRYVRLHTPWSMVQKLDNLPPARIDTAAIGWAERHTVRTSSVITSPSHALGQMLQRRWHLPKVEVIANPIPASHYLQSLGREWIYVGRIEYRKGVHILLEAYHLASQQVKLPPLTLQGHPFGLMRDGCRYEHFITSQICRYKLEGQVRMAGGTGAAGVREQLGRSCVAIFPSLWENFPYACLEAMASGLAVVAADCGGLPEQIEDERSGLLFKSGDAVALSAQLIRLAQSPSLVKSLGRQARIDCAQKFDTAHICEHLEGLYDAMGAG